jgi:hypothetical protein
MKKIVVLFTCLLMLASASFGQAKPAPKTSAIEDTIQYSLGVYMMQQFFAKTGFVVNNPTLFTQAINDVLGNKKLMVDPTTTQARLFNTRQLSRKKKTNNSKRSCSIK